MYILSLIASYVVIVLISAITQSNPDPSLTSVPALPRARRHQLCQLQREEQAGRGAVHDGLPLRQVHPLRHGLRHGRAREARHQVQGRAQGKQYSQRPSIKHPIGFNADLLNDPPHKNI